MEIPVLYSDEHLLVCEKPVGVSSESPGLPDLVSEQSGRKTFPVHRLDAGTGGAVILAFSAPACAAMQKLFRQDLVLKEYLAVVCGRPESVSGRYEDLLFHDRNRNKTYVVDRMRGGVKKASCEWTLLETAASGEEILSLVRVRLHTGCTHQIRAQFASRGLPLAGDRRYGSQIKADAPALWAARVSFPHPLIKGRGVEVSSLPPPVFPWSLFPSLSL